MLLSSLPPFLFAPTLNQTINKHQKSSSPGMAAWQRSNSVMPGSCINQTVRTNKRSITFECKARKIGTHSTFALRLTPIARDREREREMWACHYISICSDYSNGDAGRYRALVTSEGSICSIQYLNRILHILCFTNSLEGKSGSCLIFIGEKQKSLS